MAKETTATVQTKSADTKWGAFEKAGLEPVEISCQAYLPVHPADLSCHTRLVLNAQAIINHVDADHLGGFAVTLRKTGRSWPGWLDLKTAGIESYDFRCDVCDAIVPMQTQHLLIHMKPHPGKSRRIGKGGKFWMTVGHDKPVSNAIDATEEDDFGKL